MRPRKLPHPHMSCCTASDAEFAEWATKQVVKQAQARELIRNLRAAADLAEQGAFRLFLAQIDPDESWTSPRRQLQAGLEGHSRRLNAVANGHAQQLQMDYGCFSRIIEAHPWRLMWSPK